MKRLRNYQESFCLEPSTNDGQLIWKCTTALSYAIVVGVDFSGEEYVIFNQPEKANYTLAPLSSFATVVCHFAEGKMGQDFEGTAAQAFQYLELYNDYNKNSYTDDHRFGIRYKDRIAPRVDTSTELFHVAKNLLPISSISSVLQGLASSILFWKTRSAPELKNVPSHLNLHTKAVQIEMSHRMTA
ncbi:hypothetical protein N8482_00865 [Chitinophagales bacterium]|nr:hypothetical protein [Chitinophagales bacterium]